MEDWTPEPLVGSLTTFEEAENEKTPVIVGCVRLSFSACVCPCWKRGADDSANIARPAPNQDSPTAEP